MHKTSFEPVSCNGFSESAKQKYLKSEIVLRMWYTKINAVQCPPLNRITLGQHKSGNNNRMFQLTDIFFVLFRYNGLSNI